MYHQEQTRDKIREASIKGIVIKVIRFLKSLFKEIFDKLKSQTRYKKVEVERQIQQHKTKPSLSSSCLNEFSSFLSYYGEFSSFLLPYYGASNNRSPSAHASSRAALPNQCRLHIVILRYNHSSRSAFPLLMVLRHHRIIIQHQQGGCMHRHIIP